MTTIRTDDEAMHRALELARRGIGYVEPNPAVGAVIVSPTGEVVGEGFHQQYGGPHAEVHAIAAAGDRCRGATLYCTLEPCSHFGKTPPCAPQVVQAGIRRVVVAMGDPAPHVAGEGLEVLRQAGVEVVVGVCEREARRLTAPFVTLMTKERPYVHAKWAMTLDGRIATRTGHSQWISGEDSRTIVHELRGRMDAILVGRGTALADDPLLTARAAAGRPPGPRTPLRVVLDSSLQLSVSSRLVQTAREVPLLVATTSASPADRIAALRDAGVDVEVFDGHAGERQRTRVDLAGVMRSLAGRKVTNLLAEGGSEILGALWDADLLDEFHVFLAPKIVGGTQGLSPIGGAGLDRIPSAPNIEVLETRSLGSGDVYLHGVRAKPRSPANTDSKS